jgi:hypothetical protein
MKSMKADLFKKIPARWLAVGCSLLMLFDPGSALAESPTLTKQAQIHADTPSPKRFVVRGAQLIDQHHQQPVAFRGIGYSPFMPGETPMRPGYPADDGRYKQHLSMLGELGVNYLHVFPLQMPRGFFTALDGTPFVYGQDIWIDPFTPDLLDEKYQAASLENVKKVIDHTYATGRPDRLLLFSVGDELQAASVVQTNQKHPQVNDYRGKYLTVTGRSASEVAMAKLIDAAMAYELDKYGQRHLYCHTSWTHIGPIADRPDLDLPREHVLLPDMGDLLCMNIYTYAHGVLSSPPGSVTGSRFQGYLEALADLSDQPILLTQVGLSTSPIMPKPEVVDYGGRSHGDVSQVFRSVWKDFRSARGREKYAGLAFFEFTDEWWKIGWVAEDEHQHQPEDPEEWFGIYEVDAQHRLTPKGEIPATLRELFRNVQ